MQQCAAKFVFDSMPKLKFYHLPTFINICLLKFKFGQGSFANDKILTKIIMDKFIFTLSIRS
jgi:hypothetical protein